MLIVDKFSKYVVYIPAPHVCPIEGAARLFFNHVVKHFGLLQLAEYLRHYVTATQLNWLELLENNSVIL